MNSEVIKLLAADVTAAALRLQVWFHSAAWGIPGALTVMLLALNKVEGDNISGVCFVGLYDLDALRYFVLAPLCMGVAVGLFLILAGIVSLNNVRQVIQHDERNQEKLKKFMIRIGVFSCLYLVPLVTLMACYTYEQSYRSAWEKTWVHDRCQEYSIPCPHQVRQPLAHPHCVRSKMRRIREAIIPKGRFSCGCVSD